MKETTANLCRCGRALNRRYPKNHDFRKLLAANFLDQHEGTNRRLLQSERAFWEVSMMPRHVRWMKQGG